MIRDNHFRFRRMVKELFATEAGGWSGVYKTQPLLDRLVAILEGFGDVKLVNVVTVFEVGYGASHFNCSHV